MDGYFFITVVFKEQIKEQISNMNQEKVVLSL